ncbi:heme/hemin ABC transporter substrate-binding protein [Oharaeibacter diazotrophicus]|uniref:Iron complex transport system substrate-binding protein n=1 Tax=Oharaeibacter diazotrophicus TaxID=1920512 RepID=A0A4R6RBL1_9HYPH|nr:ABC transporter substrate-binding protein [Oharaeibacter diazotrophicus]TDP83520.1 iron complex transport system substrate-binding protein [Oharaeibacter diazotrophicus]BBE72353.1 hemin-binding periplasmic protein HmuT precursor [Pleomorphomonas sp. SM30]GLS79123.1 hemin ABC transporter substrate-binding protein [Oharaeibacter diazotrophicus]
MPPRPFRAPARAAALALAVVAALPAAAAERIVSIGGAVTEIAFALGAADRVVAVDSTSTFPAEADGRPDVGYMRQLAAEGVLSVAPDLVLLQAGSGPPDALAVIRAAVKVADVPETPSAAGIGDKIRAVGTALGKSAEAEALAADVAARFAALEREVSAFGERRRVLFVLSMSGGRIVAGGRDTTADAAIRLAGGINAADGFSGFKPMVDEAVIAAAPDVVVVMNRGDHALAPDDVFALPAFASTPAAAGKALIAMDGLYLLGFGPREPEAVRDLAAALYPGRIAPATATVAP